MTVLDVVVRERHGKSSEKLAEYGLQPFRRKPRTRRVDPDGQPLERNAVGGGRFSQRRYGGKPFGTLSISFPLFPGPGLFLIFGSRRWAVLAIDFVGPPKSPVLAARAIDLLAKIGGGGREPSPPLARVREPRRSGDRRMRTAHRRAAGPDGTVVAVI